MPNQLKVFAPATVGNLGVGFDLLGFAIHGPGDEIIFKPGKKPGLTITKITGARGKLPTDPEKNTAGVAAMSVMKYYDAENEAIEIEIRKKMPMASGMGSSAASAVAGAFGVAKYLRLGLQKKELLKFAMEGEFIATQSYQADNVAPSLLGGMILTRDNTTYEFKKIHIPEGLIAVVIYPHIKILSKDARDILSPTVTLAQHTQQAGNLASLIAGLYTSDFELIKRSIDDVIIEPQRAKLIPHFYQIKEAALDLGALGFSISGAGPAMFALCDNTMIAGNIIEKANEIYGDNKIHITTYLSSVNHEGAFLY